MAVCHVRSLCDGRTVEVDLKVSVELRTGLVSTWAVDQGRVDVSRAVASVKVVCGLPSKCQGTIGRLGTGSGS